jgi:hypothetical protein
MSIILKFPIFWIRYWFLWPRKNPKNCVWFLLKILHSQNFFVRSFPKRSHIVKDYFVLLYPIFQWPICIPFSGWITLLWNTSRWTFPAVNFPALIRFFFRNWKLFFQAKCKNVRNYWKYPCARSTHHIFLLNWFSPFDSHIKNENRTNKYNIIMKKDYYFLLFRFIINMRNKNNLLHW